MSTTPGHFSDLRWLKQLASPAAGDAWKIFVQRYAGVLISVVRQYQRDEQAVNDLFLFVCERLSDKGFRRLRSWKPHKGARFDSWLRAVVANLCIDFLRAQSGRTRPPRAVAAMGELEQGVFSCRFGQHLSLADCLETLRPQFPDLNELSLAAVIADLNRSLDSRQHWRLKVRQHRFLSFEDPDTQLKVEQQTDLPQSAEDHAVAAERHVRLQAALAQLPESDRVLLRLRFEQDLPLREVARIAGLSDLHKARYQIDKALEQLARLLGD
ncbi:MAG: sigma-70 family RNA polymerase sigma factor [Lysobacterales bacterium]|nr:MAG: sigma-70 family RNA polymerase sigma factor [Xanthomonadales bacterium]